MDSLIRAYQTVKFKSPLKTQMLTLEEDIVEAEAKRDPIPSRVLVVEAKTIITEEERTTLINKEAEQTIKEVVLRETQEENMRKARIREEAEEGSRVLTGLRMWRALVDMEISVSFYTARWMRLYRMTRVQAEEGGIRRSRVFTGLRRAHVLMEIVVGSYTTRWKQLYRMVKRGHNQAIREVELI